MAVTLAESDIDLVQLTFAQLLQSPKEAGDRFYGHLFASHPEVRPLFKDAPGDQSEKFITMLSYIVSCLDNLDELDAVLMQLGKRHIAYRTEPAHYPAVKEALMLTLRDYDSEFDDADGAVEAWGRFYDLIAARMIAYGQ